MTRPYHGSNPKRILIFLVGSLGDTLVALPALHLIKRRFPNAERRILTNYSHNEKAAPMSDLLEGSGLASGYFRFPTAFKSPLDLLRPLREIRRWKPDLLVHLHEARGLTNAYRDVLFFRACGVRRMIGIPWTHQLQNHHVDEKTSYCEHRTDYLGRRVGALGDQGADNCASWELSFSEIEHANARVALSPLADSAGIITISIGAKIETKDWGDEHWMQLLRLLVKRLPAWGLAIVGAPVERERSARLMEVWEGKAVNLCGQISLRECGAALKSAAVFVGHDSGPMHFAASVGTPTVAIFSARELPGKWFPYGKGHTVFYTKTPCFGCLLDECHAFNKKCILSIDAVQVANAVEAIARTTLRKTAIEGVCAQSV